MREPRLYNKTEVLAQYRYSSTLTGTSVSQVTDVMY